MPKQKQIKFESSMQW